MTEALLSGDLEHALNVWSLLDDPIDIVRVPGPAGPLYHLGSNGAHRLHTARLLGLPAVWAEIRQDVLPLEVTFGDATPHGEHIAPETLTICWRGLLERGLAAGRFDDTTIFGVLHPDAVMASWMLAPPDCAITWAAAYDRAYPGALNQAGVPVSAWQDPQAWLSWLATEGRPVGDARDA
ncbi:hypothetical protein [Planomonospora parontospora]|uniref:hypothetical protein n=1 Tax=Planomonospora parontospora TaxID=58119 RepID=UPI001670E206|nr:hypothetical protein [Planomonospora parontospora]